MTTISSAPWSGRNIFLNMLRDYQQKAVDEIRNNFKEGRKKVLLKLSTGGGKTVIFSHILRSTVSRGNRAIMVVRGRHLVDQASSRLFREGAEHGVLMSKHWLYRPTAPIQLCSIDTLRARKLRPAANLIVIDEAHMATSDSYKEFLNDYPTSFILGVTATPYGNKSLSHIADCIVNPITMMQLIEQGYLVPPRYFAPSMPDVSKVKISASTGDYQQDQLNEVMDQATLTGDIVEHWLKFAEGRKTICFAVSIEHSKHLVEEFCHNGIVAEHMDADTPDAERKEILNRLEKGSTNVISNVGILCTGVDLPYIGAIIMARPTKSYNLYIQQAGRGTRPFENKKDFILLDHAGNVCRHGFITNERDAFIEPVDETASRGGPKPKVCANCFAIYISKECSGCGSVETAFNTGAREVENLDGTLGEIISLTLDQQMRIFISQKKQEAKRKGYKKGWVYYQIVEKFGGEMADKYMPKRIVPPWVLRKYG